MRTIVITSYSIVMLLKKLNNIRTKVFLLNINKNFKFNNNHHHHHHHHHYPHHLARRINNNNKLRFYFKSNSNC